MQESVSGNANDLHAAALLAGRNQALAQIQWMRNYTLELIESVPQDLWYVMPSGCATHIAWQVGHLAVAQYGLMLFRQRGRIESDIELMPGWLRKNFGRGSSPAAPSDDSHSKNPSPASLLERLHAIHVEACQTVATLTPQTLLQASDMPYVAYANNLGALLFCPLHESIHAGQIGVLRRLHGLAPIR